jgi:multisubunit Na+/H+ antiporter MnhG subunit
MKNRGIVGVILLPFVTFGIYTIYWFVSTKEELNQQGAEIPTAWLLIVPIANIFWMYKYFEGAEKVTNQKVNAVIMLIISLFITPVISSALCQSAYNNLVASPMNQPPIEPQQPMTPPPTPIV